MSPTGGGLTGGCQCGAVRYRLEAEPDLPHLCHCRMCQKAMGSYFAALAVVPDDKLVWTRGEPRRFASSTMATRGFCGDCGTPLTFQVPGSGRINFSLGSLDDPSAVPPDIQIGMESRVPFFTELPGLKTQTTQQAIDSDRLRRTRSHQHPDHDTADWPAGPTATEQRS